MQDDRIEGKFQRQYRLLLIEDNPEDMFIVEHAAQEALGGKAEFLRAGTMAEAKAILAKHSEDIDIVFLDLGLPDTLGGMDSLEQVMGLHLEAPVIIVTGNHNHKMAMALIEHSAADYINKDRLAQHPHIIRNTIDFAISRQEQAARQVPAEQDIRLQTLRLFTWLEQGA